MANLLKAGAAYLQSQLERHASESIYVVDLEGKRYGPLPAIVGQLVTDASNLEGFVIRQATRDFTIRQALLPKMPERNWRIWQTVNGDRYQFIVNGDNFSTAHVEDSDGYGIAWRIHTRFDAVVANAD